MNAFLLAVALLSATASAQPASPAPPVPPVRQWPSLQDWDFTEGKDFCEMMTSYGEGPEEVSFALVLLKDGKAAVGALNTQWTFEKGKSYDMLARLTSDGADQSLTAVGHVDGDLNGFIVILSPESLDEIVKAGKFIFSLPGTPAKGNFNVEESERAYTQLKTCLGELEAGAAS